jgi:hypothetical protein
MGGLFLILPIVAFDVWLICTTGKRQLAQWRSQKNWRHPAVAAAAGLLLAAWFAFLLEYSSGAKLRVRGFPIPVAFFHLDGETWTRTTPPLAALGAAADVLTGLVSPCIPYKIAEFLRKVKTELK